MAARRRGLTPEDCGAPRGRGVEAPVGRGVEEAEGSSEVKMVAEEGEILYFSMRTLRRVSLKPVSNHNSSGQ